jgi:hypothetical protein
MAQREPVLSWPPASADPLDETAVMLGRPRCCGPGGVVRLLTGDIDSKQTIILVESKDRKDRHVILPAEILDLLCRPGITDGESRRCPPGRGIEIPSTKFHRVAETAVGV